MKNKMRFLPLFLAALLFLQIPNVLQADGWGRTEEVSEFEGTSWNGVFLDMNGLNFTASLPNYSGGGWQNNTYVLRGHADNNGYVIMSPVGVFTPPKTVQEFIKMVQEANSEAIVSSVDAKNYGAKYVVDIVPTGKDTSFWRILCTKDRLIKMGTLDTNAERRYYFFDSVFITK